MRNLNKTMICIAPAIKELQMNKKAKCFYLRKLAALLAVLLLLSCFAACKNGGNSKDDNDVRVTEAPDVEYSFTHLIRYWPEDADYDSCDYSCVVQIPQFSLTYTYGYAMNQAVELYIEDLHYRIENDYMLSAIADHPHSEIKCTVEQLRGVTNIIFDEEHDYEAQPNKQTYVLMLDDFGNELNLCDVILNYHAETIIAGLIADRIASDGRFYSLDANNIAPLLDIAHGASATKEGCRVFLREGTIAPFEEGELAFNFTFEEIFARFGEAANVLTFEEYKELTEMLCYCADAAIVREENIKDGVLTPFEATSFMGEAVERFELVPQAGRITVSKDEFETFYKNCFGADFPGIESAAFDIKLLDDGGYSVSAGRKPYEYHIDILSAAANGNSITLNGDMIFGTFGYAFTSYVCHVSIVLERNPESPFGFTLIDFGMSL